MTEPPNAGRGHILLPSLLAGEIGTFSLSITRAGPASPAVWGWIFLGGLVLGGWIWFSIWTWRRVARSRDGGNGQIIYNFGVLGFGLSMWVTMAFVNAARDVGGLTHVFSTGCAGSLLQHGVIGFPLYLWGGYLWGKGMGYFFKIP